VCPPALLFLFQGPLVPERLHHNINEVKKYQVSPPWLF
jgi:hypothetical protein